jgi:hypothetical protein
MAITVHTTKTGQDHRRRRRCPELDGTEVMAVTSPGWSVDQTSYRLVFEALRESV